MDQDANAEPDNVVPIVSRASRMAQALQRARAQEQSRVRDELAAREGRLASLADELRSMGQELPDELPDELPAGHADRFDLVAATSTSERIIIDGLSYVDLHPQSGAYRLMHQRREGPQLVAQSVERDVMADRVADHIAAQIVAQEGLLATANASKAPANPMPATEVRRGFGFWGGFWLFLLGALCSATALFTYAWLDHGPTL